MQQLTLPGYFPLSRSLFALKGPDAADFLGRITTVNVNMLDHGLGAKGTILSAQGKFKAVFTIWRETDDRFLFEVPSNDGWAERFQKAIEDFTFAERMELNLIEATTTIGVLALPNLVPGEVPNPGNFLSSGDEGYLFREHDIELGMPYIRAYGKIAASLSAALPKLDPLAIEYLRISQLRPEAGHEITEQVTPLDIGLKDAVASNKGCYPGQEVIEKIISLGSPPKRLALLLFEKPTVISMGLSIVSNDGSAVGELTSTVSFENETVALGTLRKTAATPNAELVVRTPHGDAKVVVRAIAPYQDSDQTESGHPEV